MLFPNIILAYAIIGFYYGCAYSGLLMKLKSDSDNKNAFRFAFSVGFSYTPPCATFFISGSTVAEFCSPSL